MEDCWGKQVPRDRENYICGGFLVDNDVRGPIGINRELNWQMRSNLYQNWPMRNNLFWIDQWVLLIIKNWLIRIEQDVNGLATVAHDLNLVNLPMNQVYQWERGIFWLDQSEGSMIYLTKQHDQSWPMGKQHDLNWPMGMKNDLNWPMGMKHDLNWPMIMKH